MNEFIYRIENSYTQEVIEFKTFKAAWKKLNKLRASEGRSWPYVITNTSKGTVHTFRNETDNRNITHHAILCARANKILYKLYLLDDSKLCTPTAINVHNFARDMRVEY